MHEDKLVAASAIAVAVTLFAIFSLRPLARRLGLVDRPDARKCHRGRVPVIGGLCFFLGTIAGLAYLGSDDRFVGYLLAVGALVLVTGFLDDLNDLSVRTRLLVEAGVVALVIVATGVYVDGLLAIGDTEVRLHALGVPLTIIAVVGLINAFNMLDGIDGLAGSLALVCILAILAFAGGGAMPGAVMLLQVLSFALVPYLFVNLGWPDGRKIFMGDAGSTLLGFLLGWSLVYLSSRDVGLLDPMDVPWCIALPIMDTMAVMYRRMQKGASPFKPDRQHLHHLLLDAGFSARESLLLIVVGGGVLAGTGYALRGVPDLLNLGIFVALFLAYLLWLTPTLAWLHSSLLARRGGGLRLAGTGHWPGGARTGVDALLASPRLAGGPSDPRSSGTRPALGSDAVAVAPAGRPVATVAPVRALCVVGASPGHIRMVPLIQQLERDPRFDARICVTAPNELAAQVIRLLGITIDRHLETPGSELGQTDRAAATLNNIRQVLREFQPDVVVVHGDTPTTLATALAAYYEHIPLARLETGSAQEHAAANWPHEANHKTVSALASFHLASTETACLRLADAGVARERIRLATAARVDGMRAVVRRVREDETLGRELAERFAFLRPGAQLLFVPACAGPDNREGAVSAALRMVASACPGLDIVCPGAPGHAGRAGAPTNLHHVDALDHLAHAWLLDAAHIILASSGDFLDEATLDGKAVLLTRDPGDDVAAGERANVRRVGADAAAIAAGIATLLADAAAHQALATAAVGDGCASDAGPCIIDALSALRRGAAPPAARRVA